MKEPIFERFVNLVMNDTTYCMDEGFDKLIKLEELNVKIKKIYFFKLTFIH